MEEAKLAKLDFAEADHENVTLQLKSIEEGRAKEESGQFTDIQRQRRLKARSLILAQTSAPFSRGRQNLALVFVT